MGSVDRNLFTHSVGGSGTRLIKGTRRRDSPTDEGTSRHQAMRVLREGNEPNGRLVFGEDEPVLFDHAIGKRVKYLTGTTEREAIGTHVWFRLEFKADTKKHSINPGDFLTWAESPYENGWVNSARFKVDRHHTPSRGPQPPVAFQLDAQGNPTPFSSAGEMKNWLEALDYDWWETGNYLTAGFHSLDEPQIASPIQEARGVLRNEGARRTDVLGVCGLFPEATDAESFFRCCERELLVDKDILEMTERIENGTFKFWPSKRNLDPQSDLVRKTLQVGANASSDGDLLSLSIRQAMAGPPKNSETYKDKPVAKVVEQRMKDHLNNICRQMGR